jgi:hypothetical protein
MRRPDCSGYEHNEVPYAPFREAHVTERELPSLSWYDAGTRVTDGAPGARQYQRNYTVAHIGLSDNVELPLCRVCSSDMAKEGARRAR